MDHASGPDGHSRATGGAYFTRLRHAAVGEDLAVGLARRAVRHLVGLVRDPAQTLAAFGTRRARPVVHPEALAELRLGQPARPLALALERVGERRPDRVEQRGALLVAQRRERRVRRDVRAVERVVRRSRARSPRRSAGRAASCGSGACRCRAGSAPRTRRSRAPGRASRAGRRRPARAPTTRPCARCRARARGAPGRCRTGSAPPRPSAASSSAAPRCRADRPARGGRAARTPSSSSKIRYLARRPTARTGGPTIESGAAARRSSARRSRAGRPP